MLFVKLVQNLRQHGRHRETGEADAHVTHLTADERVQFGGQRFERTQQWLDPFEQELAGGRDLDAASGAVEQVGIERGFELRNRATERGLGDREGLGGLPKMELPRDLAEVDEVAEFERELILA